jgi:hypothetical protein
VREARTPNTGEWLLQHPEFTSFERSDTSIPLWFCGPPGAGKTVLASLVIDYLLDHHILKDRHVGVAWFYCDYTDDNSMTTVGQTLSCLLRQLLNWHEQLPDSIMELYNRHKQSKFSLPTPPFDDLLVATIRSFSKVFIVVDALDEYPSSIRAQFLGALNDLKPSHLLITSREHIRIEQVIPSHRMIPILAHEQDINSYVDSRLETFRLASRIRANPDLRKEIITTVVANTGAL